MQKESRLTRRQRVLLSAKILFNDRQSVFDCIVKNISSDGARLKVTSCLGIPDHFTLYVPHYEERFPSWVVWSDASEIGVSFSPRPTVERTPDLRIVD